jgi:hypothetical protein
MSFMKRLFTVRNVRTIVVLASMFGIIFLSFMMIDKDNSIAQTKQYEVKSYIKIDGSNITRNVNLQQGDFNVRQALNMRRKADGNFTLIEINVGGESLYILASDVCVSRELQRPIEQIHRRDYPRPVDATNTITNQLEQMNAGQNNTLFFEVPDQSCYPINSRWL